MKRGLLIVGLILLAAALVFLNQGLKKVAPSDHDEEEQAQQASQPQPPAPGDPTTAPPPEEAVGDPAAKHHITVGWMYDERSQQKPETLNAALQAIRNYVMHSRGAASAEIVDLDVPAEDRSAAARVVTVLGIQVDGRPLYSGSLSTMPGGPGIISGVLNSSINNSK